MSIETAPETMNPALARRMAHAIAFLTENWQDQPRLEDAARATGLSPAHFQRQFTRWVGVSPKTFVGCLTLDHARRALEGDSSVMEAAWAAGLSGPSRLHDLALKIEALTPGDLKRRGAGVSIAYGFAPSPFGEALVMRTRHGVCGLGFCAEGEEDIALADMQARWPAADWRHDPAMAAKTMAEIFGREGRVPLHLMGTPWQVKVWQALLAIPPGRMTTYEAIARQVCTERASRAVGTAVGLNPVSWLVPCHRVLRKSGALAGYHWGLTRKRAMLALEAAQSPKTSAME
jgi:AraC family transcriptional regulator, regulatory protein of adaptative response / methylated-DNA-[protein]-cysteine methyltransferase